PWLCPSGSFACKTFLTGSELPRSPVPAVLPFPTRVALPAAGSSADTPSQVSDDSSHCLPQVPRPSPAAQWTLQRGPTLAIGFQDLSTAVRSGAEFLPAIQLHGDKRQALRSVWLLTPESTRDCSRPCHRADPNAKRPGMRSLILAADLGCNTRGPGNTTHPCSWVQIPPLFRAT